MTVISANDLKVKGVSALERALKDRHAAIISVRGTDRFVVMDVAAYNRYRELELDSALAEVKADLAAKRIHPDSVARHIRRVSRGT